MTVRGLAFAALLAVSAHAAAPAAPALDAARLAKIVDGIADGYNIVHPGAELCRALEFPKGERPVFKYRGFVDADKTERKFARAKQAKGYLLVTRTAERISYLRVDPELTLVAGAYYPIRSGRPPIKYKKDEAGALLARELSAWAAQADR